MAFIFSIVGLSTSHKDGTHQRRLTLRYKYETMVCAPVGTGSLYYINFVSIETALFKMSWKRDTCWCLNP